MGTLVLPLSTMPTTEGDAFALLAQLPDGTIKVEVGTSWAAAAASLAPQLEGAVSCDEGLSTVGRRLGWKVVTPTEHQLLTCAAIAVGLSSELPLAQAEFLAFCSAWVEFYRLRMWEAVPAELCVRAVLREGKKATEKALAVLGQAGMEYGLAYYEDPRAFDAMWSGESYPLDGVSVLADGDPGLLPAFQPFAVPAPVVTRIVGSRAKQPRLKDFVMATAAMQVLINVTTGEPTSYSLGKNVTLELMQQAPEKKTKKKKR